MDTRRQLGSRSTTTSSSPSPLPHRISVLLLAGILCLIGCSDPPGDEQQATGPDASLTDTDIDSDDVAGDPGDTGHGSDIDEDPDDADKPPSHVSQAVKDAVTRPDFDAWRGRSWEITPDATLPDDWMLETPPAETWGGSAYGLDVVTACDETDDDCDPDFELEECDTDPDCQAGGTCEEVAATVTSPGDEPRSFCVGHSHRNYDVMYGHIHDAEQLVDVTSLYPPDGPFLAAIRNAITYLANAGESVELRLQFASTPLDELDVDEVIDELGRDLPSSHDLQISVGTYQEGLNSWNHAKIVAVDGDAALVGGMNMSTHSYLRNNPVFDLSMSMTGATATDAHRFADGLWDFVCDAEYAGEGGFTNHASSPDDDCPTRRGRDLERPETDGDVWTASLGRYGDIGPGVADAAITAALASAEESLKLSVQDIGPMQIGPVESNSWPTPLLDILAKGIADGIDVEILMTTPVTNGGGSDGAYSNGWSKDDLVGRIEERLRLSDVWLDDGETVDDVLCDRLRVSSLRPYDDATWPDGEEFANHAKSFIVDDRAFYIGSQNLYPAELAEFGYLIDDDEAAEALLDTYWDPLWATSESEIEHAC